MLLCVAALIAQLRDGGPGTLRVGIKVLELAIESLADVCKHGLIEVNPAEPLEPFGLTEQLESVVRAAQYGGVERAPAEVVDGDDGTPLDSFLRGIMDGGCFRLGDQHDVAQAGLPSCLADDVDLERPVAGRMCDRDDLWSAPSRSTTWS